MRTDENYINIDFEDITLKIIPTKTQIEISIKKKNTHEISRERRYNICLVAVLEVKNEGKERRNLEKDNSKSFLKQMKNKTSWSKC